MIISSLFFAASISTFDASTCHGKELPDRFKCIEKVYNDADKQLNVVYNSLYSILDSDYGGVGTPRSKLLKLAQRDWIKYRDSSCDFEHPIGMGSGGEGYGVEYLSCLLDKTKERIYYLENNNPNVLR